MHEKEELLLLKRYGVKVNEDTSLNSLGNTHFLISELCLVNGWGQNQNENNLPRIKVEQLYWWQPFAAIGWNKFNYKHYKERQQKNKINKSSKWVSFKSSPEAIIDDVI